MTIKLIDILSEEISSKVLTEQSIPMMPSPIGRTRISPNGGEWQACRNNCQRKHNGIDFLTPSGTIIRSPLDGKVGTASNQRDNCGGTITIKHEGGFKTIYCHVKDYFVRPNDDVIAGQPIGLTGGLKTDPGHGNTTGAHLHFGIKKNNTFVDPTPYVDLSRGFDDMVGTQSSQQPISQDYEDEPKKVDRPTTGIPLKGSLKQHLPYISDEELSEIESEIFPKFEEFIENNEDLSHIKNQIKGSDIMVSEDKIYYVVKMDKFADILYIYNNGKFELVR